MARDLARAVMVTEDRDAALAGIDGIEIRIGLRFYGMLRLRVRARGG